MAKKRLKPSDGPGVEPEKLTSQARLELPIGTFERLRGAAKNRGQSVSAFIRMAVLKEVQRVEEGRDL